MAEYVNSPPEAFESIYDPSVQRSVILGSGDKGGVGAAEEAAKEEQIVRDAASGKLSEQHKQIFDKEASLLGISTSTPGWESRFLAAHAELLRGIEAEWVETVNKWSEILPGTVAEDIVEAGEDVDNLTLKLRSRLANNWTAIMDPYLTAPDRLTDDAGANPYFRNVRLSAHSIIGILGRERTNEAEVQQFMDRNAQHELLHSLSAVMFLDEQDFIAKNQRVTSGISVKASKSVHGTGVIEHGTVLNEGTIEQYRRQRLQPGEDNFAYEDWVAILNVADGIDPPFQHRRLRAMMLHEDRGRVIGDFERIFGPLSLEKLEEEAATVNELADMVPFKKVLLGMLDKQYYETASERFDEVYRLVEQRINRNREVN